MRYRIEFKVLDSEPHSRDQLNGYWSRTLQCVEVEPGGLVWPRRELRMELPAAQAVWDAFNALPNIAVVSARPSE